MDDPRLDAQGAVPKHVRFLERVYAKRVRATLKEFADRPTQEGEQRLVKEIVVYTFLKASPR